MIRSEFGDRSRRLAAAKAALAPAARTDHDSDMEARVAAIETDMKEVKTTLGRLEPMIVRIDERLRDMPTAKEFGELKGRVSQLPTTLQMGGFVLLVLGIAGALKIFT